MESTERKIIELNNNYFFEEFTFGQNKFIDHSNGQELEFADNVIWIDDFFLIFQIKERNSEVEKNIENWFKSKIEKKAVQQIKNTLSYINKYDEILITNEKGVIHDIAKAKINVPLKLIVYNPGISFNQKLRDKKCYLSSQVGCIHLLHIEDYNLICNILITPYEILDYLQFREKLIVNNKLGINYRTENYVLKHYLTNHNNFILNNEIDKLEINLTVDLSAFDISDIVKYFKNKIIVNSERTEYYFIIKELAKLHRLDLKSFKERFNYALDKCRKQEFDIPYRMVSSESKCGFVFIPLLFEKKDKAQNGLQNFTKIHMYDQQLEKGIGMICYYNSKERYFDIFWTYKYEPWEKDLEFEALIYPEFPLRPIRKELGFRYDIETK